MIPNDVVAKHIMTKIGYGAVLINPFRGGLGLGIIQSSHVFVHVVWEVCK